MIDLSETRFTCPLGSVTQFRMTGLCVEGGQLKEMHHFQFAEGTLKAWRFKAINAISQFLQFKRVKKSEPKNQSIQ